MMAHTKIGNTMAQATTIMYVAPVDISKYDAMPYPKSPDKNIMNIVKIIVDSCCLARDDRAP
jgi:hypothetical protein